MDITKRLDSIKAQLLSTDMCSTVLRTEDTKLSSSVCIPGDCCFCGQDFHDIKE